MILQVDSIRKRFGTFTAVDGVSLSVAPGAIYGLLGPNGAGKTTTIRMIMGIFFPDEGQISIFGKTLDDEARDSIGYLPEERGLYKKMKVQEMLTFFGRSRGLSSSESNKRAASWLSRMELSEVSHKKVEELSKGMQQKVQFIGTILHQPKLLVLDEPFSGLDPINTQVIKDAVLELNSQGTTVIFSTHNMEEAEKMCNSICLINHGRVVVEGDLKKVKASYGRNSILVEGQGDLRSVISSLDYLGRTDLYENYAEIRLKDGATPGRLLQDVAGKLDIRKFEVVEPTLRTIFIDLVGGGNGHE